MSEIQARSQSLIDRLLRGPSHLFVADQSYAPSTLQLLVICAVGYAAYGLVIGSFAGGEQWWAAPLKAVLGALLCNAICFPSLYIFLSLSSAVADARQILSLMMAQSALTAVLLAGFAPVAWVFSQSATTVSFIGAVHLLIWALCLLFAQRLVRAGAAVWGSHQTGLMVLWSAVFLVTALQMSTALRPWVGTSDRFLPTEKKFFVQHWFDSIADDLRSTPRTLPPAR